MKYCNTCSKEKKVSEFGNRKASPDGLSPKCKECQRVYDKARLRDPKRIEARRDYQKTERGKKSHSLACKKWLKNNEIKRASHTIVGNALRAGRIVRATNCESCNSAAKLNAHHDDYAFPLSVRWLCGLCHADWHKENGEGLNAT